MKHGHQRQRQLHREKTSSVICLPPPKPPIAAPRPEPEVARAMPLPKKAEPHTLKGRRAAPAPLPQSRQLRRQTKRAQAKAVTRGTAAPAVIADQTAMASTAPSSEPLAPLPKNRALALTQPRGLTQIGAQIGNWLRSLVMVRRPASGTSVARPAVSQIKALRREVAMIQRTLDQLLESSRA